MLKRSGLTRDKFKITFLPLDKTAVLNSYQYN